jgi:hypothetical protein
VLGSDAVDDARVPVIEDRGEVVQADHRGTAESAPSSRYTNGTPSTSMVLVWTSFHVVMRSSFVVSGEWGCWAAAKTWSRPTNGCVRRGCGGASELSVHGHLDPSSRRSSTSAPPIGGQGWGEGIGNGERSKEVHFERVAHGQASSQKGCTVGAASVVDDRSRPAAAPAAAVDAGSVTSSERADDCAGGSKVRGVRAVAQTVWAPPSVAWCMNSVPRPPLAPVTSMDR